MADRRGLGAALAGALAGARGVQDERQEHERKLELLRERMALEQSLRMAIEGERQDRYDARAQAAMLASLRNKIRSARVEAEEFGFQFPDQPLPGDEAGLRGRLADIQGLSSARKAAQFRAGQERDAAAEARAKAGELRAQRSDRRAEESASREEALFNERVPPERLPSIRVIDDMPYEVTPDGLKPMEGFLGKRPSPPPFGTFSSRVQFHQSVNGNAYGDRNAALRLAARELFGIELPDTLLQNEFGRARGEKEVYDLLSDHYRVMGSLGQ